MTVVVTHTTPADGSFSTTGAAAWNADHTLSGVGTMAGQDANAVAITGGSISGVSGVVTSVAATAGTGISITGSPITSSGTLNITNTAPDQTVVLTAGTGISTSGTYPNFTITNTSPSSGGTVTSVTGTAPVVSSGGTTPAISMAAATTLVDGYLTSADWATFNGKQAALVSGTNIKTVNSNSLLGSGNVSVGTVTSVGGTGTVNGLSLSGTVTSSGNLTLGGTLDLSSPPAIGSTAANTGAFTTLSASSTVSGTGFSTYLASPPAIGGTTASTGRFTTVTSTVATGTAPFTVASTTAVANLSIGGNAGTVTNGVYTTDTGTVTNTMLAGSIANAKLTNSSITFGSTAQALGSTVSAISGVTIDNGAIGGTTAAAGTFTTLIGGSGSANYEQITGGATGKAVQFQSLGSDAAVSLAIQSKGTTGAIDLSAQGGVNISNGGTVTAITRTAAGVSYTSPPSVAISAPTTAGGVQATATSTVSLQTIAVNAGGSGYLVGDVLTLVGGTGTAATITVATLSGSAVATVNITSSGAYTVIPSNPISVTGGTGTSATFTASSYALSSTINITNAGSGYVEQPTVTFSGGGGSGAAAYAAVGSNPIVRTLGGSLSVYSPGGEQLRVGDTYTGGTSANYIYIRGRSAGAGPIIAANGSDAAVSLNIASAGTGSIGFQTANGGTTQFFITNTTSAVNYVQVTGAATTGAPTISSQGSDANPNVAIFPKGLGIVLMNQQTPTAVTATGTLTIANLLTQIITSTSATAVSLTLPTGTLSDAGVSGGTSAVNTSFDYSIINTGSAVGDVTLVAGTGHTIVGSVSVPVGTSGRFRCRKTATNTFVSYRV